MHPPIFLRSPLYAHENTSAHKENHKETILRTLSFGVVSFSLTYLVRGTGIDRAQGTLPQVTPTPKPKPYKIYL